MITKIEGKVCVDNVMWQPLFQCNQGCQNCYVAKSEAIKTQELRTDILDLIYTDKKVVCDQFTLSLDTISNWDNPKVQHLINTLRDLWYIYEVADDCGCPTTTRKSIIGEELPQLCITAYDEDTVANWAVYMFPNIPRIDAGKRFLAPLTLLSLSSPYHDGIDKACKETRTQIQLNLRAAIANKGYKDLRSQYYSHIKNIYHLLDKPALGEEISQQSSQLWYQGYNYLYTNHFPNEEKQVIPDACILDSENYLKTGHTCGAGITKLHVWPNGSVTACPYDSHRVMADTELYYDTWEELQRATDPGNPHSMTKCKIPEMIKSFHK